MQFSDEYIAKLSETTGASIAAIRLMEQSLLAEIEDVLTIARELEPSGRITKKLLKLVLKTRTLCNFV